LDTDIKKGALTQISKQKLGGGRWLHAWLEEGRKREGEKGRRWLRGKKGRRV